MMHAGDRTLSMRVPATSANLGPGFDTMGIALSVHDEVSVTVTDTPGIEINIEGVGAEAIPRDDTHLIIRSMRHVYERVGTPFPRGIRLSTVNRIPHSRGMGSSGSAIVAGVRIACELLSDQHAFSNSDLLGFATEIEGHPDNVAPALFGGLSIAWTGEQGPRSKKLMVHRGVSPLVLVPEFTMSTELARSLQPEQVPYADAVFNVSRSSLLVAALTQNPELLFVATEDRLHQDYRGVAMPRTKTMVETLRSAGHPAVVSGAGPSILVLCNGPQQRMEAATLAAECDASWEQKLLTIDILGATVEEIS